MSTRRQPTRALRPLTESLEGRWLLSKTISGVDADGDQWTLTLTGPGDFRVTNVADDSGNPIAIGQPAQIDQIQIAGGDPTKTRLIGQVVKGPNGDGKVFFDSLTEEGGRSEGPVATNGVLAIDMPGFWLGHTETTPPSSTDPNDDSITIPDGIQTLRFGGVDTTFTPTGGTPLSKLTTSSNFNINLGLPRTKGTSIIVSKVISGAQPATGTATSPVQQAVTFNVNGRLNVFQADEIDGSTAVPSTGFRGGGGTVVVSQTDTVTGITGQIGFIRVGGNATDFAAQTNDKMANFYVGGEANNVLVLSPAGLRDAYFGKGMDTTTIYTHELTFLQANRGAVDSKVFVERNVGNVIFGGPVKSTALLAGINANLGGTSGVFATQTAPTSTPAQDGGSIANVLVAGDVTDSVFAASTEPATDGSYGGPDSLYLPHGRVTGKVEGSVDNSNLSPDQPTQAFYAKKVTVGNGPVVPPTVPEAPFPNLGAPPTGSHVVHGLQKSFPTTVRAHTPKAPRTKK
jgi:hypothetical protein